MSEDNFDNDFSQTDSGSSMTYPVQAGTVRKGGYIMIKGRPCKVVDVSTSKTGKHGHAKAHFVAIDIFTGKKCEELCPTSHNIDVPNVTRTEYQVLDAQEGEDYISLMDEDGNSKDDLRFPDNYELVTGIIEKFNEGVEDVFVTTISAMGEEMIVSFISRN